MHDKKTVQVARGLGLTGAITITGCIVSGLWGSYALAQITPDGTLGIESSVVTPNVNINGGLADRIDGGATRGTNLFHSFTQFNVGDGQRVYFANSVGIENILTRVTGTNISNIQGTLGVTGGNANLFLINPNGIIFGKNARLDVGGSFVATTANAIGFGNQGFFSASTPESPTLLTVNPSAFFFNQINAGRIENRSIAPAGVNLVGEELFGLQVPDGRSLLLVGGDIVLDGGGLTASSGRVKLVGVAGLGTVGLNTIGNSLSLSFPEDVVRADISITNKALVSTSGEGGGEIQVWGRRVMLNQGSQIVGTTLGEEAGGGLTVDASESVELLGTGFENFEQTFVAGALSGKLRPFTPGTGLFTGTVGTGAAGDIAINTKQLILQDGAIIFSPTFSQGTGGSLTVRALESVEAIGSGLITSTLSNATGAAGDITIDTQRLIVRDGALVTSTTLGDGTGGDIAISASESVEVLRTPVETVVPTGIFAATLSNTGIGGNMLIDTRRLIIRGGAQVESTAVGQALSPGLVSDRGSGGDIGQALSPGLVSDRGSGGDLVVRASELVEVSGVSANGRDYSLLGSGTAGVGQSGDVKIITPTLLISDKGVINAGSGRTGSAGDVEINTGVLIAQSGGVIGATSNGNPENGGNLTITASESVQLIGVSTDKQQRSGLLSDSTGRGDAGNIRIHTPVLLVQDGASIAVDSRGSGKGGNIQIRADSLILDNQATLLAETASNTGGNITLQIQDLLLLRNNSRISTTAGTAQAGGDGGNITIDARNGFIVAVPKEDSDITANAFKGRGGNINIIAQGIYGIEFRPRLTPLSDITASSETGVDGIVDINKLDVDPVRGIANLPTEPVNTEVAQDCQTGGGKTSGSFINTGRGGLPTNPYEPLSSNDLLADVQPPTQWTSSSESAASSSTSAKTNSKPIVEANGWRLNENGEVVLVAPVPPTSSQWDCRLR